MLFVAVIGAAAWIVVGTVESRRPPFAPTSRPREESTANASPRAAPPHPVEAQRHTSAWMRGAPNAFCAPPANRDGWVAGVVVDRHGWPIGEATVRFDGCTTSTRGDGTFEIAVGDDDDPVEGHDDPRGEITATAVGYVTAVRRGVRAGDSIRLRLSHLERLGGRVHDEQGVPVAGATVAWSAHAQVGLADVDLDGTAVTGADGRYEGSDFPWVPDFASGRVTGDDELWIDVEVTAEGFAPRCIEHANPDDRDGDGVLELDLEIAHGVLIHGTVVDGVTGHPRADARVLLFSEHGDSVLYLATTSDRGGDFSLGPVATRTADGRPAKAALLALVEERAPGFLDFSDLLDAASAPCRLVCSPATSARGRVFDVDGEPVAGARVTTDLYGAWRSSIERIAGSVAAATTQSDGDGQVVLSALPIGTKVEFSCEFQLANRHCIGGSAVSFTTSAEERHNPLSFCVVHELAIEIVVVDEQGRRLDGARVASANEVLWTGLDGACLLDSLVSERVDVDLPGYGRVRGIESRAGTRLDDPFVITLEREHRVSGRIWIDDDPPRRMGGGVSVFAVGAGDAVGLSCLQSVASPNPIAPLERVPVSSDGWFEARGLPRGPYDLVYVDAAHKVTDLRRAVDADTFDLDWVLSDE